MTVEACPIRLCVESFRRDGIFESLPGSFWTAFFTDPHGTSLGGIDFTVEESGPTGLGIQIREQGAKLNSQYTLIERHLIPVTTTRPYLGGRRFWFLCPMVRNGKQCARRVARLYLPRGQQAFGCRHCHNLTYRSAREHDHRVYLLARDLAGLDLAIRSGNHRKALLGVSAAMLLQEWSRKGRLSRFVTAAHLLESEDLDLGCDAPESPEA